MIAQCDFKTRVRDKLQQQWREMMKKSFAPTEWYLKEDDREESLDIVRRSAVPQRGEGRGIGTGSN